jgi:uncharacterized protein (TIGR03118 family)
MQMNLTSDVPGLAQVTDPNLVNPWGIVPNPNGPFWVNDNGTGLSTLYGGDGTPASLVVTVPPPTGADGPAAPTGIVFDTTNDFTVRTPDGTTGTAVFMFATEDGTISGWSPSVDLNNAILMVDNSASGAVYKGLALGSNSQGDFLYATNFRAGTIDVFDTNFNQTQLTGSFTDPQLPQGYAPFGIQNINGQLFVTYAKQDAAMHDDVPGHGHGFVDVFDTDGNFQFRLASKGRLDSPWGLALAPAGFGQFGGDLLIGNFGNGHINAFNLNTREFDGTLRDANNLPIINHGLWGLSFGNGATTDANTLFFTAGINDEQDGLFGSIQVDAGSSSSAASDRQLVSARPESPVTSQPVVNTVSSATDHQALIGHQSDTQSVSSSESHAVSDSSPRHVEAATETALDTLFALDSLSMS